jgi:hypothetical protein
MDDMYADAEPLYISWDKARNPNFNIVGWYQKCLNKIFDVPGGKWNKAPNEGPRGRRNVMARHLESRLENAGPYPGEVYWKFPKTGRFFVTYNRGSGDYKVVDHALCYRTMMKADDVKLRKEFSVGDWYRRRLVAAYENLWNQILSTWDLDDWLEQMEYEPAVEYTEKMVLQLLWNLEAEARNLKYSKWVMEDSCYRVVRIEEERMGWGDLPVVQTTKTWEDSGLELMSQTVTASKYKSLKRNAASRKDVSRHVPEPITVVAKVAGRSVRTLLDSGSLGDFKGRTRKTAQRPTCCPGITNEG